MTREEAKSCIGTIEMLQRLAYNIHGVMDVIDADNCKKIIKALEQEPISSEIPNKSIEEKCPCYHCEFFEIKEWSHCKIHEDAYGDSKCSNYHKANQDSNKTEIPTGSDDCISREQALDLLCKKCPVYNCIGKCTSYKAIDKMPSISPQGPRWIPDSERLPESSGNYLITYCYQGKIETQEAVYVEDEEGKWFDTTDIEITLAVIAWMPLPEPYKAESEEV